jgi:hypothetical protein
MSCHADDSALRECDESRGTRYSERHSGQPSKTQAADIDKHDHSCRDPVGRSCRVTDVVSRQSVPTCPGRVVTHAVLSETKSISPGCQVLSNQGFSGP